MNLLYIEAQTNQIEHLRVLFAFERCVFEAKTIKRARESSQLTYKESN